MDSIDFQSPILSFADEPIENAFNIVRSFNSVLVLGAVGSGKTSAVGRKIISAYLKYGYSIVFLTSKVDDADLYKSYAADAGRAQDVIEIRPDGEHAFNFMQYESTTKSGVSLTRNLQDLLEVVLEAGEERNSGGGEKDRFWSDAQQLLIKSTINLLMLAYSEVTIPKLYAVAMSTPTEKDSKSTGDEEETEYQKAMKLAKSNVKSEVDKWKKNVDEGYLNSLAQDQVERLVCEAVPNFRILKMVNEFFTQGLYTISPKTKGVITLSFSSFLGRLLDDPVYDLFCNCPSTFTPESCIEKGSLVIVNMPVSLYGKVGQDVQIMLLYIFQKSWQRRDIKANGRPLAIVCDECQNFLHPQIPTLLATARSSRISTLFLSQNLPAFYSNVGGGGSKAEAKVEALLSLLTVKIFLANGCARSNKYAAELFGRGYVEDVSSGITVGDKPTVNEGSRYILEDAVRPEEIVQLRCGGPPYFQVEAYIHMLGVKFNNGFSHKKIIFNQKLKN